MNTKLDFLDAALHCKGVKRRVLSTWTGVDILNFAQLLAIGRFLFNKRAS